MPLNGELISFISEMHLPIQILIQIASLTYIFELLCMVGRVNPFGSEVFPCIQETMCILRKIVVIITVCGKIIT
jgi:hypothetical protein